MMKLFPMTFCWCELIATYVTVFLTKICFVFSLVNDLGKEITAISLPPILEQYYRSSACHQQNPEKRTDLYPHIAKDSKDAVALSSPCILEYRLELKDWNRNYIFWMPTQGSEMSSTGHETHPRRLLIFNLYV